MSQDYLNTSYLRASHEVELKLLQIFFTLFKIVQVPAP